MNKKDIINSMMPEAQYGTYKKRRHRHTRLTTSHNTNLAAFAKFARFAKRAKCAVYTSRASSTLTPLDQWHDNYEVMEMFHISQRTLQTLRSNGKLPFAKMGGRCYYKESDLQQLLEESYRDSRVKPMPKDKVMPKVEQPAKEGGTPCQ